MIITIGRTHGSGGREIGIRLAERLNIPHFIADMPGLEDGERVAAIRNIARQGSSVMVGFCADHLLEGTPGLLRVFIYSDIDHRANRISQKHGISREEAVTIALRQDRERAMIYGHHTKAKWTDISRYDLAVNRSTLGIEDTVELLCQFVALKVMRKRSSGHDKTG